MDTFKNKSLPRVKLIGNLAYYENDGVINN